MKPNDKIREKHALMQVLEILHYIELDGKLEETNVLAVLKKLGLPSPTPSIRLKSKWNMFKEIHVYSQDDRPIFFIKELWETGYFREILGIHIGIHFLDPELCPARYAFGLWRREGKKDKPIIITSYVQGDPLRKDQVGSYSFELGRQHVLHQVLSMYDVDYRHLIVQQGLVVRIDFGRAFTNLNIPYQGFWELQYKRLKASPAFHDGIAYEAERIKQNLARNQGHLKFLFSNLEALGYQENLLVDIPMAELLPSIQAYWKNHVPFPVLDLDT